jgi:hypothetical protein
VVFTQAVASEQWVVRKIGSGARAANWCGWSQQVVWEGTTDGIHLYDLATGIDKIVSPSWRDTDPFCRADGRFVFYSNPTERKTYAYDVESKKTTTIECISKDISLSPDMQAAATTASLPKLCRVIHMPWGENVPVQELANYDRPGFYRPIIWKWFPDNRRVVLGYIGDVGNATIFGTRKGVAADSRSSIAIYDLIEKKLTMIEGLPRNTWSQVLFLDGGRFMYFGGKESPDGDTYLYRVDTNAAPMRADKLGLRNFGEYDLHPRWGLLYKSGVDKGLGTSLWLTSLNASNPGRLISDLLWGQLVGFSQSGGAILMARRDIKELPRNEMTPIPNSVYILSPVK